MFFQRKAVHEPATLPDHTLRRASHIVSTTQSGETVLLDPKRGQYHTLNTVGSRVWELLASGATLGQLVSAVRDEYELPPGAPQDQVERDITQLLSQLRMAGLIVSQSI